MATNLQCLGIADVAFVQVLYSLIDTSAHHKAVNEQGKAVVMAFAAVTVECEVPGVGCGVRWLGGARLWM